MKSSAPPSSSVPPPASSRTFQGIVGAPGVAIAKALVVEPRNITFVRRAVRSYEIDHELERFTGAVEKAKSEMRSMSSWTAGALTQTENNILEAYLMMLEDKLLADAVERHVRINRQCVEWAVSTAVQEFASTLALAKDPYLQERARDCEFVGERLLLALSGSSMASLPRLDEPCILVADELSPADLLALSNTGHLAGLLTERGTRTSHTAILARAIGLPAVLGVPDVLRNIVSDEYVILDGLHGTATASPTLELIEQAHKRRERYLTMAYHLRGDVQRPAQLASGELVHMYANLEVSTETPEALKYGAEGVGLYRTEYLYMERDTLPSEDEQFDQYCEVVRGMAGRLVTFRTFDLGGDKLSRTLPPGLEPNPALGARAVRLALQMPQLFSEQLRAMIRASFLGPIRIMIPMVSCLHEWGQVRKLYQQAIDDVDQRGQSRASHLPLGLMVEVPSAAILVDRFAAQSDFLSLGTNDLVQYTLAVDRSVSQLAHLASPFHPAILSLIQGVVRAARRAKKPLTVCGAMASDPLASILLVGLGVDALSVEPTSVPEIKETLRRVRLNEATGAAEEFMKLSCSGDIEAALAARFAPRLFDLLRYEHMPTVQ